MYYVFQIHFLKSILYLYFKYFLDFYFVFTYFWNVFYQALIVHK